MSTNAYDIEKSNDFDNSSNDEKKVNNGANTVVLKGLEESDGEHVVKRELKPRHVQMVGTGRGWANRRTILSRSQT